MKTNICTVLLLAFLVACDNQPTIKENLSTARTTVVHKVPTNQHVNKEKSCHINFPKEQAHFMDAQCLSLPLSSQNLFQSYPFLLNGYIDLDKLTSPKDYKEFLYTVPSSVPEYARILGIIPYNNKLAWVLIASNRESEESEGDYNVTEQAYELFLFNRKNGKVENTIGIGHIDTTYQSFYDNPKLFKPPFNFKKTREGIISFYIKDTVSLPPIRKCIQNFKISNDFLIDTHRICYKFSGGQRKLQSEDKRVWKLNKETMEFEEQENE